MILRIISSVKMAVVKSSMISRDLCNYPFGSFNGFSIANYTVESKITARMKYSKTAFVITR
jgi:hypothetical protein